MTVTKGLALIFTVMCAGALMEASSAPMGATTIPVVRLKTITSRVGSKGASLVIEASEPVPYVATRPDPLTVLVDVHNVAAEGVANSVAASAKSPIAGVVVEPAGAASRIRIALTEPVAHHVRAERNTIVIDFEPPVSKPSPFATASTANRRNGAAAGRQSVPDAMRALETGATPVDPVVALGLDQSRGSRAAGVLAQSAGSATLQPPTAPQPLIAPAPSPQPPQIGVARSSERRFTGHPISLDFQGADLRAVLRTFAEMGCVAWASG